MMESKKCNTNECDENIQQDDIPWYLKDIIKSSQGFKVEQTPLSTATTTTNTIHDELMNEKDTGGDFNNNIIDLNVYGVPLSPFIGSEDEFMQVVKHHSEKYQRKDDDENKVCHSKTCNIMLMQFNKYYEWRACPNTNITVFIGGVVVALAIYIVIIHLHRQKYVKNDVDEKASSKVEDYILNNTNQCSSNADSKNKEDRPTQDIYYEENKDDSEDKHIEIIPNQERKSIIDNKVDNMNDKVLHSSQKSNQSMDISSIFDHDVPVLAEIISRSGLDKQESIKIVTKQILETDRRTKEELRRQQTELLHRLEQRANQACHDLMESINSTFSGGHFHLCVIIGCITRFLLSHSDYIKRFMVNDEDPIVVFDFLLNWFSTNVCGCLLENSNDKVDYNAFYQYPTITRTTTATNGTISSWLSYYSILPSISLSFITSIINISPIYTHCILKLTSYIFIISSFHRILRICHCSNTIHHLCNICIFFLSIIKTKIGRSIMILIMQIFTLNGSICCIAYVYYIQKKKVFDFPIMDIDVSTTTFMATMRGSSQLKNDEKTKYNNKNNMIKGDDEDMNIVQCLRDIIIESKQMIWKIYISSILSAILLGIGSFISMKNSF